MPARDPKSLDLTPAHRDPKGWQVHRFGDTVAAYLGNGETVYLTPWAARELSRALSYCSHSVRHVGFVESNFETRTGRTDRPYRGA